MIGKVEKSLRIQFLLINYNHQTILVPANLPLKLLHNYPQMKLFVFPLSYFLQSKKGKQKGLFVQG